MSLTRRLARFIGNFDLDAVDPHTLEMARLAVVDWLGSVVRGSLEPPAQMARRVAETQGAGGVATLFPDGTRVAPAWAAFVNGVSSHIIELDDLHQPSTLHPAAPVIPAALAAAQEVGASGRAFLAAVIVGYEVACRIGEAVNPSHYRFWHPTGTSATFGAAAAAGFLYGLDEDALTHALGSAGTQAAGLWQFLVDGAMSKHLHAGKAAMNGLLSAALARQGFTGAQDILEGPRGYFAATAGAYAQGAVFPERITDGLGVHYKIAENSFKLHSCCGHTHTAIDAALQLRPQLVAQAGDHPERIAAAIEHIDLRTYGVARDIVGNPQPTTPYQAKFSQPYCVAAALLFGRAGLEQFQAEVIASPAVQGLLARTRLTVDDALSRAYPEAWSTQVTVCTSGRELALQVDHPRGTPQNPATAAELVAKARELLLPVWGAARTEAALALVASLDTSTALPAA